MLLYHFTAEENLEAIQAEGLKPRAHPARQLQPEVPERGRLVHARAGPPGWWPVELNTLWFYVEVVLPTSGSRLMSFERWLRENHPGYDRDALDVLPEFRQSHWRDHYLYFGTSRHCASRAVMELYVGEPESSGAVTIEISPHL